MGLTLPPHHQIKGSLNEKFLPRCGRKIAQSDSVIFFRSVSPLHVFVLHYLVFCFLVLSQSSFMHYFVLFNLFLFFFFSVLVFFFFSYKNNNNNWKIKKIQKQCMFVYIGTCVPWMAIETNFFKLCIVCSLDEYLYAQLSNWVLWLVFVMSKIKWSLVLNTHITLFCGND